MTSNDLQDWMIYHIIRRLIQKEESCTRVRGEREREGGESEIRFDCL